MILLASGYGVWCGWRESLVASAVIAALLVIIFAVRVLKTRRMIPAGILALLSLATLVIFLSQLM
ncbi:MAG: TMEM14 family protein [Verrucomicrobiia bacterium]